MKPPDGFFAKAIMHVTSVDIQKAAGSLQLCAGQVAGVEAAIHGINLACFPR